jgi:hypothetical protein
MKRVGIVLFLVPAIGCSTLGIGGERAWFSESRETQPVRHTAPKRAAEFGPGLASLAFAAVAVACPKTAQGGLSETRREPIPEEREDGLVILPELHR